jgi:hypothetical protein
VPDIPVNGAFVLVKNQLEVYSYGMFDCICKSCSAYCSMWSKAHLTKRVHGKIGFHKDFMCANAFQDYID